ncbi:MAG TPA: thioredoxin [Gemmatimonadales bacterium]|nr:thioredoxin [Gemmatimonadales bacterium]
MATKTTESRKVTLSCLFCGKLNRVDLARVPGQQPRCGECGRPILLDRPVKVTDEVFDRVIQDAEVPVIVDFYADWCGPCKMMAPVFDELASEWQGRLLVLKHNTDESPATPQRFGIKGIPTLILFSGGREVARQVGAVPKAALEEMLRAVARESA